MQESVIYSDANITPFWQRIPKFFRYPFHTEPLLYSALLAAASLLGELVPAFLVELGILLATLRYAFRIMEQTSLGYLTPDQFELDTKPERANLPYKLFGILMIWGVVIGVIKSVSAVLGFVANVFLTLALPASVMALSASNSFAEGLNPASWINTMRTVGKPYLALWVFLFLLMGGGPIVLPLLAPLLRSWLALPVVNFVFIYFTLVMFNMMGYCLYQYHHMLGLKVKVDFDAARDSQHPAVVVDKPRDTAGEEIAARVASGDLKGALGLAHEQARTAPEDIAIQERYHKLLLLGDRPDSTLNHAQDFISLLLRKERSQRALEVFKACRELRQDFALEDPGQILKLAQAARRAREYNLALALVTRFDKRHPQHPDVPGVYLMSAQILSEHFKKDQMATLILKGMMEKFPDHPLSAEAGTYLKVLERMADHRAVPPPS
ncbi:MAG TPA: hypothetical protein VIJ43_05325 [Burkholderiales bacterium]